MTKYRIVERNRDRWGDNSSKPYYYVSPPHYFLQVKIFDLFWIDYHKYPFAHPEVFNSWFNSYSHDLGIVENFYQELMKKQEPYIQTVVKTFYDETT